MGVKISFPQAEPGRNLRESGIRKEPFLPRKYNPREEASFSQAEPGAPLPLRVRHAGGMRIAPTEPAGENGVLSLATGK